MNRKRRAVSEIQKQQNTQAEIVESLAGSGDLLWEERERTLRQGLDTVVGDERVTGVASSPGSDRAKGAGRLEREVFWVGPCKPAAQVRFSIRFERAVSGDAEISTGIGHGRIRLGTEITDERGHGTISLSDALDEGGCGLLGHLPASEFVLKCLPDTSGRPAGERRSSGKDPDSISEGPSTGQTIKG